jgi:hypothetical protein
MDDEKTLWHPGPPAEAIQLSVSQQKLFLVWIRSKSTVSKDTSEEPSWDSVWTDDKIKALLEEHVISLQLEQSTSDAAMFLQLINQPADAEGVWIVFAGRVLLSFTESPSVEAMQTQLETTVSQIESFKQQYAQSQQQAQAQVSAPTTSSPQSTLPESLRSQLAARRTAQEQRKQAHDRQEKESLRKAGERQSTSLDPERQKYIEQKAKERAQKQEEKRKILDEIENDKAERRARAERERHQVQTSSGRVERVDIPHMEGNGMTKVSIRQPNSGVLKNEFGSDTTLSDVRKWIDENRSDGSSPYVLQTTFPTRTFEAAEEHSETVHAILGKGGQLIMKAPYLSPCINVGNKKLLGSVSDSNEWSA